MVQGNMLAIVFVRLFLGPSRDYFKHRKNKPSQRLSTHFRSSPPRCYLITAVAAGDKEGAAFKRHKLNVPNPIDSAREASSAGRQKHNCESNGCSLRIRLLAAAAGIKTGRRRGRSPCRCCSRDQR